MPSSPPAFVVPAPAVVYQLAFDVSQAGYRAWWFPAIGLLCVGVGVALVKRRELLARKLTISGAFFVSYGFLGGAILWTGVALTVTLSDYLTLSGALRRGEAQVTEGPITELQSATTEDRVEDRFTVCGVPFNCSDDRVTAGFDQTRARGSPVREGLWVRISNLGARIARLEIATAPPAASTPCRSSGAPATP